MEKCSQQTAGRVIKNELKPWRQKKWCVPAECDAEFECAMENVPAAYKRPYDPERRGYK